MRNSYLTPQAELNLSQKICGTMTFTVGLAFVVFAATYGPLVLDAADGVSELIAAVPAFFERGFG